MNIASPRLPLAAIAAMLLGCGDASVTSTRIAPEDSELAANRASHSVSAVYRFADMGEVGSSMLSRHGNSISMTFKTSDIPPGMAVTIWWVVFNRPWNCSTSPCGEPDIFDPAVMADVLYAAGHVTGAADRVNYGAQLRAGDADGSVMGFFNALLALDLPSVGLRNVHGAEVHLVARTHQEALPAFMPDMISTFNGGCGYPPGVPTDYGAEGPNTCTDIQFAIHQP